MTYDMDLCWDLDAHGGKGTSGTEAAKQYISTQTCVEPENTGIALPIKSAQMGGIWAGGGMGCSPD